MEIQVYKTVEKKSTVFGLPMYDLILLIFYVLAAIFVGTLSKGIGFKAGRWYYGSVIITTAALYFFLRRVNKKNLPNYISSIISKIFFQYSKINSANVCLPLTEEKKKEK